MKKINVILGVGVLALTLLSFSSKDSLETVNKNDSIVRAETDPCLETASNDLALNDIVYISEEESFDLGFDTAPYLPAGFNPYEGMEPNLNDIPFIEETQEVVLVFDTAWYLPIGFNAYEGMKLKIEDIEYLELEEDMDLNLNRNDYLPKDFQANSK